MSYIEGKKVEMSKLGTTDCVDLYKVLKAIVARLAQFKGSELPDEVRPLKLRALRTAFDSVSTDLSRMKLLNADMDFFDSLDLPSLLNSSDAEERDVALNFCCLLHIPNLQNNAGA